jgi:hypothetical protein
VQCPQNYLLIPSAIVQCPRLTYIYEFIDRCYGGRESTGYLYGNQTNKLSLLLNHFENYIYIKFQFKKIQCRNLFIAYLDLNSIVVPVASNKWCFDVWCRNKARIHFTCLFNKNIIFCYLFFQVLLFYSSWTPKVHAILQFENKGS